MSIFSKLFRYATFALSIAGMVMMFLVIQQIRGQDTKIQPPPVQPAQKPFPDPVAATGIIEAMRENVAIGSPVPGLVLKVDVKVNQDVKEGDALFHIDDREIQASLLRYRAQVQLAKAKIDVQEAMVGKATDMLERVKAVGGKAVSVDEVQQRENDLQVSRAQLAAAASELAAADADVKQAELLVDRLVVRAPRTGTILQLNIRDGEYAPAMPKAPLIVMGDIGSKDHRAFHVRADVDEQSAARIDEKNLRDRKAYATVKGDTKTQFELTFDRIEPYVIPKVSLTGASTERVDTRVLQVIFKLEHDPTKHLPLYVGQQMDVFIDAPRRTSEK
jgi:multidrug resistance efflux pump